MRTDGFRGATGTGSIGLLTATGAATTYDTTLVIHYGIKGKGERKAAITSGAFPTAGFTAASPSTSVTLTTLAASEGCVIVLTMIADGTVKAHQSAVKDLGSDNEFIEPDGIPDFPDIDLNTYCPWAYIVFKNGSTGSTFTFGSSNWNATGMVLSIQDVVFGLPDRPKST